MRLAYRNPCKWLSPCRTYIWRYVGINWLGRIRKDYNSRERDSVCQEIWIRERNKVRRYKTTQGQERLIKYDNRIVAMRSSWSTITQANGRGCVRSRSQKLLQKGNQRTWISRTLVTVHVMKVRNAMLAFPTSTQPSIINIAGRSASQPRTTTPWCVQIQDGTLHNVSEHQHACRQSDAR